MKKRTANAKLIIEIESHRHTDEIFPIITKSVFDNRTGEYWNRERIAERGIEKFGDLADLKESANWNLNGDSAKYRFMWGQSCKARSTGYAYIFD